MKDKKKRIFIFSVLTLFIITVGFIVLRNTLHREPVISDGMEEEDEIVEESAPQSQTDLHNWVESYHGPDEPRTIDMWLTAGSDDIQLTFNKDEFFMHCESFPNGIEEFTMKDESGNITLVPCFDNGPDNNLLISEDREGYKTLVELLESGEGFTFRVKGKDTENKPCYQVYDVTGYSAPGLKGAIKRIFGDIEL